MVNSRSLAPWPSAPFPVFGTPSLCLRIAYNKRTVEYICLLYTSALPEIAKNVAEPLSKVDKITMYGEGNSAKLLSDIVNGTTQVTEGISAGMGLDLKSLLAGALGGKLAAGNSQPVQVTVTPQAQPDAARCV